MHPESVSQRLSLIPTLWSLVLQAHQGPADAAACARQRLLERYGGAVQRYLRKVLRGTERADDIFQDFALRLLRGDLRGANPERGRFRNFVKGTLFHLIADEHKRQQHWPRPLPGDGATLADARGEADFDAQFIESWRDELLARAWAALAHESRGAGNDFFETLRFRADHPELRSPQLAEQLSARLGKRFTADAVRQSLHRARKRFAELLIEEVVASLEDPARGQVEEELVELGLLDYCRPALERGAACM